MARSVEIRFAFSGKVASVAKKSGDKVSKGEVLASLDPVPYQAELDRQLADYEKVRAEFEIFTRQHQGPVDEITGFLKTGRQAQLNASVKEVELAKYKLDQVRLVSPVAGWVTEDGALVSGQHVTPASSMFVVTDLSSLVFRLELTQDQLPGFLSPRTIFITLPGISTTVAAVTSPPVPGLVTRSDPPRFIMSAAPSDTGGLFPGMTGQAQIQNS